MKSSQTSLVRLVEQMLLVRRLQTFIYGTDKPGDMFIDEGNTRVYGIGLTENFVATVQDVKDGRVYMRCSCGAEWISGEI